MPETNKSYLFICFSYARGGLELNVFQLALALQKAGKKVCVVGYPQSPILALCQEHYVPCLSKSAKSKKWDFSLAYQLATLAKSAPFTHLIATTPQSLYLSAFIKTFHPKLESIYYQQMQLGKPKKNLVQKWVQKKLDYWLTPLPYLKQQVLEWTNFPQERIYLAPLGIDFERLQKNILSKQEAKSKLGFRSNQKLIGLIGRIDPHKKQDLAIRAFSLLPADIQDECALLLIGEETLDTKSDYGKELYQLIQELGLTRKVSFIGFQANISPLISALDVLLMCTSKETYGMITVEGITLGVPVVGAASGGTLELLGGGQFGTLFEPDNAESLKEAILLVLNNYEDALEKARLAQHYATENLGMSNTLDVINSL